MSTLTPFRIGLGYDLHRLEAAESGPKVRPLVVGGVRLESPVGPVAHSDGDVLLHALVDAILGALAGPDIGQLFPDDDPANDGRNSRDFVARACELMRSGGWRVGNLDATVILERPRISPVKEEMRRNLARMTGTDPGCVNVKGKSHERVDAVGEGRAIEAHVAVLLVRASMYGNQS